jgi:uncharacterized protein (TIGR03437 family)
MSNQGRADAWNRDGSMNLASNPAPVGGEIALLLTGLGAVGPSAVSATVGGKTAQVTLARPWQDSAGIYEVNLILPQLAPGDYPLQLTAGGVASNTAVVSVQ